MSKEVWKPIKGWEDRYHVSNRGRIKSLWGRKERIMKLGTGGPKSRYPIAALSRDWKTEYPTVHRLVLEAFVGPCPRGMEACHNNGKPADNRVENLRWDTHKANMADQLRHGTRQPRTFPPRRWTPGGRGRVPNWYKQQIQEVR